MIVPLIPVVDMKLLGRCDAGTCCDVIIEFNSIKVPPIIQFNSIKVPPEFRNDDPYEIDSTSMHRKQIENKWSKL
jgi:hypothetical protein